MDQTQTTKCVSRFEHRALRPRLHREGFSIHYLVHRGLPPREPPPRRICTTGSTELLSQPTLPPPRQYNHNPPLPKRDTNQTPPLTRGSKPQPQPLPKREQTPTQFHLYQRGIQKEQGFTTSGISQPQTNFLFPQNK